MSFQAYLDNIEDKTGLTPRQFVALAHERGYDDPSVKAGMIVDWLSLALSALGFYYAFTADAQQWFKPQHP